LCSGSTVLVVDDAGDRGPASTFGGGDRCGRWAGRARPEHHRARWGSRSTIAVSADGARIAILDAGTGAVQELAVAALQPSGPCLESSTAWAGNAFVEGAVATAYAGETLLVQTREPSQLHVSSRRCRRRARARQHRSMLSNAAARFSPMPRRTARSVMSAARAFRQPVGDRQTLGARRRPSDPKLAAFRLARSLHGGRSE
jgi:hypothetical protein